MSKNESANTITHVISLDYDGCGSGIFNFTEGQYQINKEHTLYQHIVECIQKDEDVVLLIGSARQSDEDEKYYARSNSNGKAIDAYRVLVDELSHDLNNNELSIKYDTFRLSDIESDTETAPWKCKANLLVHQAHHVAKKYPGPIKFTLIDDLGKPTETEYAGYVKELSFNDVCNENSDIYKRLNSKKSVLDDNGKENIFTTLLEEYKKDFKNAYSCYDIMTPTHSLLNTFPLLLPKDITLEFMPYLRIPCVAKDKLCTPVKSVVGTGKSQTQEQLKKVFNKVQVEFDLARNIDLKNQITHKDLSPFMCSALLETEYVKNHEIQEIVHQLYNNSVNELEQAKQSITSDPNKSTYHELAQAASQLTAIQFDAQKDVYIIIQLTKLLINATNALTDPIGQLKIYEDLFQKIKDTLDIYEKPPQEIKNTEGTTANILNASIQFSNILAKTTNVEKYNNSVNRLTENIKNCPDELAQPAEKVLQAVKARNLVNGDGIDIIKLENVVAKTSSAIYKPSHSSLLTYKKLSQQISNDKNNTTAELVESILSMCGTLAEVVYHKYFNELKKAIKDVKSDSNKSSYCGLEQQAAEVLKAVETTKAHAIKDNITELPNILKVTTNALTNPTIDQLSAYKKLYQKIESGKRNIAKMLVGAVLCFLGALGFIAGLALTLIGAGAPIGIPLKIASGVALCTGVSMIAGGGVLTHKNRERGIKRAAGGFFSKLQRQPENAQNENHKGIERETNNSTAELKT